MDTCNLIQIESLREVRLKGESKTSPPKITTEQFLLGPFAMSWVLKAANLKGKSLHLAIAIAHQCRLSGKLTIKIQPSLVRSFSVTRCSGYRALACLENAGLITNVIRNQGSAAIVSVVGLKPEGAAW